MKMFTATFDRSAFFQVSRIQELFNGLLEEEENIMRSDQPLKDKLESVGFIGAVLIVAIEAMDEYREDNILDIGNDLRWEQEGHVLSPFIQHVSPIQVSLFEDIYQACSGFQCFLNLVKELQPYAEYSNSKSQVALS